MSTSESSGQNLEPIADFSHCHEGILKKLDMLGELPALLAPALRAREVAQKAVDFFREAIFEHHLDEERELFPAVLASADAGAELEQVKALVKQLTDEHRTLEALWKRLEPGLKKVAKGQLGDVAVAEVNQLVTQYRAHAEFEEVQFLPLSQTILSRNSRHMGALGLSLHMRHSHPRVNATYI
jgi:hemerythrin-like domain-containing protein